MTDSQTLPWPTGRPQASCCRNRTGPSTRKLRWASEVHAVRRGKRPRRSCRGLSGPGLQCNSARRVTAGVEAGDDRAVVVGGIARIVLARGIESRLAHRPAMALIAIVLSLFRGLAIARVHVHIRCTAPTVVRLGRLLVRTARIGAAL